MFINTVVVCVYSCDSSAQMAKSVEWIVPSTSASELCFKITLLINCISHLLELNKERENYFV